MGDFTLLDADGVVVNVIVVADDDPDPTRFAPEGGTVRPRQPGDQIPVEPSAPSVEDRLQALEQQVAKLIRR